jgi:hypothetical protein
MIRSNRTTVKVQQDKDAPIERPVLAKAIVEIGKGFTRLLASGLNERAVIALVADSSNVGRPDIRAVLESLKSLERNYCR